MRVRCESEQLREVKDIIMAPTLIVLHSLELLHSSRSVRALETSFQCAYAARIKMRTKEELVLHIVFPSSSLTFLSVVLAAYAHTEQVLCARTLRERVRDLMLCWSFPSADSCCASN